jgi:hypothetical protein
VQEVADRVDVRGVTVLLRIAVRRSAGCGQHLGGGVEQQRGVREFVDELTASSDLRLGCLRIGRRVGTALASGVKRAGR